MTPGDVLGGSGALRGTFAGPEAAHAYAPEQARVPSASGRWPQRWEVVDVVGRTSRFVDESGCRSVRWTAVGRAELCSVRPVVPAGVSWRVGRP